MGMTTHKTILGIDVGSVSVSYVELADDRSVVGSGYAFHNGRITAAIEELLRGVQFERVGWVAGTSSAADKVQATSTYDGHVAHIAAARHLHANVGAILVLGGEKFSLIRFNKQGEYQDTRTNSGCAAGTGSFLDEQAKNLGLPGSAELSTMAIGATGQVPKVASRCAVFAKTDIIHAQQEGYSREAICRGLCNGLATIIADTLFAGDTVPEPVVLAGGLALNGAVVAHLQTLAQCHLTIDAYAPLYGALGAALLLLDDIKSQARLRGRGVPSQTLADRNLSSAADLLGAGHQPKTYVYGPLELSLSAYPDFTSERRYEFTPQVVHGTGAVEMDIYLPVVEGACLEVHLGIDIGSTSTKAVLLQEGAGVVAGAYTRTHGRPVEAVQAILEAFEDWAAGSHLTLRVRSAGTTGSGRKLLGSILGADFVVDEITAHARAAIELDPETDTIIEIGGQDAKFTTLRNGMVTSAVMNTVCAAGTGSFIEEQARRLGCSLAAYADLVGGARSPMASDRCTVFMQRDINHLLAGGYDVKEILAAVLHSVRENYLQKVAREGSIGRRICFQGATAKNRALVAAFEQRLGRPIAVSRFCHLTGALGVAHLCAEKGLTHSTFRGLDLHRQNIPLEKETCNLCNNHCKVVKAEVMGEVSAYGYLCGRDYETPRHVSNNRSGFDLVATRKRLLRVAPRPEVHAPTIGLPAALFMIDDMPLWKRFFQTLGFKVVTSEACKAPVALGKKLARAEFCAPIAAFHGHVAWLTDKADFLFLPFYLESERPDRDVRRQHCYYTQYAPSLVHAAGIQGLKDRCISPVFAGPVEAFQNQARLYAALRRALPVEITFAQFASAHRDAMQFQREVKEDLRAVFRRETENTSEVSVVLIGRPYTCLPATMNKRIPEFLGSLGVKAFFQDMLTYSERDVEDIREVLDLVHWNHAAKILESAEVVANRKGLYPVLVTSFKCAPDSCTVEFFRRILDAKGKPYLILELDEHESSVGYETRIEAAVGAFRNHLTANRPVPAPATRPKHPSVLQDIQGKTLVVPCWDSLAGELLVANLEHEGIDAILMQQDTLGLQKSLRFNTGQCIPLTAVAQGFIDTVQARGLDPADTVLWNIDSRMSCNIGAYPAVLKTLLDSYGNGFENASVYRGEMSFIDVSIRAGMNAYFAYMFGGLLRRMACRIRPYETTPGNTDRVLAESLGVLCMAFRGWRDKLDAVEEVVDRFAAIPKTDRSRPKVAIFGDLYSRDNEVINQDLARFIEKHGGEVVTTPYSVYAKLVIDAYFSRWMREGLYKNALLSKAVMTTMGVLEKKYEEQFSRVLGPAVKMSAVRPREQILEMFSMTNRHAGESMDNLLEIFHLVDSVPDVSLFVQAAPAFCCPSLVTEAMSRTIERATGVPMLTITYDGTASSKNDAIIPYLEFPRRRSVASHTAVRL